MRSPLLLAALAATTAAQRTTSPYTDPSTGIALQSYTTDSGFRFGMVLPSSPSPDLLLQIVTPLSPTASSGWGGISFGPSMKGPLLVVAWPSSDGTVTIAPRIATTYALDGTTPYTANPLTFTPIPKGTFVNATHLSATFVCGGCVNADSFDPAASATQAFGFAHSFVGVRQPADRDTLLSDHTGEGADYGRFGVDVLSAKSEKYGEYVKLAAAGQGSGEATKAGPTPTPAGGKEPEETKAGTSGGQGTSEAVDVDYRRMAPGAVAGLALVGILYFLGALSVF